MGEPRFAMLETIREYALEQLTASQDRDSAERRHAAWYLDLAERAETHLLSAEQRTWLERLEREHENLRSALAWSLRTPGAIDAGLTAAGALLPFWWIRGHLSEAREWLRRALAVPEAAPRARGRALLAAGRLAILQGQEDVALGALEESEALARQQDDVFTTA